MDDYTDPLQAAGIAPRKFGVPERILRFLARYDPFEDEDKMAQYNQLRASLAEHTMSPALSTGTITPAEYGEAVPSLISGEGQSAVSRMRDYKKNSVPTRVPGFMGPAAPLPSPDEKTQRLSGILTRKLGARPSSARGSTAAKKDLYDYTEEAVGKIDVK